MRLPVPPPERPAVQAWVGEHLDGLFAGPPGASPRFVGGQSAANLALEGFDVSGYARRRSRVWPESDRGASRLSPYIRHGLLTLRRVWQAVDGGPARDVAAFRDELLWQEYARHLYARMGRRTGAPLRQDLPPAVETWPDPWPSDMTCMRRTVEELEEDGWLVNQTRMWLASQWALRAGADWQRGEERFFAHLLDGSRAANRVGWQWTVGALTGRAYAFTRRQVERQAPAWCSECVLRHACPIEEPPEIPELLPVPAEPMLRSDPNPVTTAGPPEPVITGRPEAVWLTAESLGDDDPALAAHPRLPAVFVFDVPLLRRLHLAAKRLAFLAESLADLATRRSVEVHRGAPAELLSGRAVATTHAPVPGWRARADTIRPVAVYPWPWLVRPGGGPVTSFTAWRKRLTVP